MNARCPTPPFVESLAQELALPPPDAFDELSSTDLVASAGEEATRLTVRIEVASSRWRATLWWAGAAVAVAVALVGGRLVDSRRSATGDGLQHPAKKSAARRRVESGPPSRAERVVSPIVRGSRSRHPLPGAIGRKSHPVLARTRSAAGAAPAAVSPAEAAPPVAREPEARPQQPAESQFSYLGE
jgi:hypothetical protein